MQSAATSAVGVRPAAAHMAVLWSYNRTCMLQPCRQVCTEVTTCALKAVHLLQQQTINCCISKHAAQKVPCLDTRAEHSLMPPPRGAALQHQPLRCCLWVQHAALQHHAAMQQATCRCGRMIWAEEALLVLGRGWLRMHMARTTREVRRTFSGK